MYLLTVGVILDNVSVIEIDSDNALIADLVLDNDSLIDTDSDIDEKEIKTVKKGLKTCKKRLGKNLKRLERYFEINHMYNDAKIMEFWKNNYKEDIHVQDQLEWYARYLLGNQIFSCIENKGSCSFSAEI